jgi:DNA-binding PadR family transcriptional regulator
MNFHKMFGGHRGDHGGRGGHFARGRHGFGGGFGNGFGGGFMGARNNLRAARMLSSEDLQLVLLSLLKEKPSHGYELIKALEAKTSGFYVPSPGVIYPALTYLEEAELAESKPDGNKKCFQITEAGNKHLKENQTVVDDILQKLTVIGLKMADFQKHFADEEADMQFERSHAHGSRKEWMQFRAEFQQIKAELKAAIREHIGSSDEEKKRILGILKKAVAEIRKK